MAVRIDEWRLHVRNGDIAVRPGAPPQAGRRVPPAA
jgi:hypothetical protein